MAYSSSFRNTWLHSCSVRPRSMAMADAQCISSTNGLVTRVDTDCHSHTLSSPRINFNRYIGTMDWGGPRVRRPAIKALVLASYSTVGKMPQFGNWACSAKQNKRHPRSPSFVGSFPAGLRCCEGVLAEGPFSYASQRHAEPAISGFSKVSPMGLVTTPAQWCLGDFNLSRRSV